jgi:hypothetical protein
VDCSVFYTNKSGEYKMNSNQLIELWYGLEGSDGAELLQLALELQSEEFAQLGEVYSETKQ